MYTLYNTGTDSAIFLAIISLSVAHVFTHICAFCTTESLTALISVSFLMLPFTIGEQSTIGTFIGVGVGGSMFLLLVSSILVVIILVVVVVRRKVTYKQKRGTTMGDSLHHSNPVVLNQETELKESGVGADYKDAAGYQDVDEDMGEEEGLFSDGLDPYEVFDRKAHTKNAKTPAPQESTPTTNLPAMNAIVDKTKNNGAKKETEDGCTATNNDLYAMPMRKMGKMTGKGEVVVKSGGVEEEQYDDTVSSHYEPFRHAGSELW